MKPAGPRGMGLFGLLRSPLASLVLRPWYDRAAVRAMANWFFPLSRGWAAALEADGQVDRFAAEVPYRVPSRRRAERALAEVRRRARAYEAARAVWEDAFFGPDRPAPGRLEAAAEARHAAAHELMAARTEFLPLHLQRRLPKVRWDVASQEEVESRHGARLSDPDSGFAAPDPLPEITRSRAAARGTGTQSWLRFESPAPVPGDTAWARVAAPFGPRRGPALVFTHGICMETDFWRTPSGRAPAFAEADITVIRPEGPFHGRRRNPGHYGGEELMARGVMGLLDYFHAHVLEIGVLTAWARETLGGPVAVGGVSLGALTAELAAVAARHWPPEMRPDALFLVTPSASVQVAALEGSLPRAVGIPTALAAAGWTVESFRRWRPLLEPGGAPVVPPERIVATLGLTDDVMPFEQGQALVRNWGLPAENVFMRPQGHFSAALGLFQDDAPLRRLAAILSRL